MPVLDSLLEGVASTSRERWAAWEARHGSAIKALKAGETHEVPGGVSVTRLKPTQSKPHPAYKITGGGTLEEGKAKASPQTVGQSRQAVMLARARSLRSTHPDSLGGTTKYRDMHHFHGTTPDPNPYPEAHRRGRSAGGPERNLAAARRQRDARAERARVAHHFGNTNDPNTRGAGASAAAAHAKAAAAASRPTPKLDTGNRHGVGSGGPHGAPAAVPDMHGALAQMLARKQTQSSSAIVIHQHAKVRVVNEKTGREWNGYAARDHTAADTGIRLHIPSTGKTVSLSGPEYRMEVDSGPMRSR